IEKKWTSPLHNWSLTVQQLYIKFGERIPLILKTIPLGLAPKESKQRTEFNLQTLLLPFQLPKY
ncbi:MAG: hypothetical protein ACX93I_14965, partial [Winogradskyella sp.]